MTTALTPEARAVLEQCAAVLNLSMTGDTRGTDKEDAITAAEELLGYEVSGRPENIVRREFA